MQTTVVNVSDQESYELTESYPIKIKKLHPEAVVPCLGSEQAAGYDLCALAGMMIQAGEIVRVPLGFATELHRDIHCRIESRSGMAMKGLVVLTGVIDADYRGEWSVILMNVTTTYQLIAKGDRVAQAVLRPTVRGSFRQVEELSDTQRGANGFGSTGN